MKPCFGPFLGPDNGPRSGPMKSHIFHLVLGWLCFQSYLLKRKIMLKLSFRILKPGTFMFQAASNGAFQQSFCFKLLMRL